MGLDTPQQQVELHAEQEFAFRSTISEMDGVPAMSSADELFYNGQIKPLWLHEPSSLSHPSLTEDGYFDFRSSANHRISCPAQEGELDERSFRTANIALHEDSAIARRSPRLTRSLSATRVFHMDDEDGGGDHVQDQSIRKSFDNAASLTSSMPCTSLKELLQSEACSAAKLEKSEILQNGYCYRVDSVPGSMKKGHKQKDKHPQDLKSNINRCTNWCGPPMKAAHEVPCTARKVGAEHTQGKRTSLPYRQGLLGCLSFMKRSRNHTCKHGRPKHRGRCRSLL